jgi:hypothetical protein
LILFATQSGTRGCKINPSTVSHFMFHFLIIVSAERVTGWSAEDAIGHRFPEMFVAPSYEVTLSKVISDAIEVVFAEKKLQI